MPQKTRIDQDCCLITRLVIATVGVGRARFHLQASAARGRGCTGTGRRGGRRRTPAANVEWGEVLPAGVFRRDGFVCGPCLCPGSTGERRRDRDGNRDETRDKKRRLETERERARDTAEVDKKQSESESERRLRCPYRRPFVEAHLSCPSPPPLPSNSRTSQVLTGRRPLRLLPPGEIRSSSTRARPVRRQTLEEESTGRSRPH